MAEINKENESVVTSVSKEKDEANKALTGTQKADFIFNQLQLYFGKDIGIGHDENGLATADNPISDTITIHQPTIGDFIKYGEPTVYGAVMPFIVNPTAIRVQLWDMNIDWNKITDFQLFSMLLRTINSEYSHIIFGDLDFSKFRMVAQDDNIEDFVLYNPESNIVIDEELYLALAKYIQAMFCVTLKVEKAKGKFLKEEIIRADRFEMAHKKDKNESNLSTMISFCLNHPGFKYKLNELEDVGIYVFLDCVNRLQIYESTSALMKGAYSGFCDTSKIDKEQFNFMRTVKP